MNIPDRTAQEHIAKTVLDLVELHFDGEIRAYAFDGVEVRFDGTDVEIGCQSKTTFARGLFLFAQHFTGEPFTLAEKPRFKTLGVTLEMSRNGVMRVESVKRYIDHLAALGFTSLSLYMEDVYELPSYPRFGYLRGRYTCQELREIDDYADALGIEVFPSIETLGHMEQFLQWSESAELRDTRNILMADEPGTYVLLEEIFKTLRSCFRSDRINIGLDEAASLGKGRHLDVYGYENGTDIFLRHLGRVCALCEKYGFKPMMYSDMFFRLGSPSHKYYDPEVEITDEIVSKIPQVQMCYWDYYHTEKKDYDTFIRKHRDFRRDILFLGAMWSWEGFIEDTVFTLKTSIPAMQSCLENGVDEVMITTWGDGGAETNLMQTLGSLPIFSEYCYKGEGCTMEDIAAASQFLTKMPFEAKLAMARSHSYFHEDRYLCKKIVYANPFYDLVDIPYDYERVLEDFTACRDSAKALMETGDRHREFYGYCYALMKIAVIKLQLLQELQPRYKAGDRAYLQELCHSVLPELIEDYRTFLALFQADWLRDKKPQGLEVITIRLGGVIAQLEYVRARLRSYLDGQIQTVEELDFEKVHSNVPTYPEFWEVNTGSVIH